MCNNFLFRQCIAKAMAKWKDSIRHLEIVRCVKVQQNLDDTAEQLLLSTLKYNITIHSITGRKP